MAYRIFIDECLSPELVTLAIDAGHVATCSRNAGLLGTKDWRLLRVVVSQDYTFVTNNARDFRGEGPRNPGGLHAQQEIHPGLICLSSYFPMDISRQRELFKLALDELEKHDDLINQALEVFEDAAGQVTLSIYEIPAPQR